MKKKLGLLTILGFMFAFVLCSVSNATVLAKTINQIFISDEVPYNMPNNSIIRYLDNERFVVENVVLDAKTTTEVLEGIAEVQNRDESTVSFVPGKPEKGIVAYYSNVGELVTITNSDGTSFEKIRITNESISDGISVLADDDHALVKIAEWGTSKTNTLYSERGTGTIYGYGYASVFYDTIGNHNNTLVKGDCATQMKYDNVKTGTKVKVTVGSKSYSFEKNDVGALPNAIVDIWKTGIYYLGGTETQLKNKTFHEKCSMVHPNTK